MAELSTHNFQQVYFDSTAENRMNDSIQPSSIEDLDRSLDILSRG
jgi:hypothetical protein